jgi:hypothetical protein
MKSIAFISFAMFCAVQSHGQNTAPEIPLALFKISPQHALNNTLKIGVERFNRSHARSLVFYLSGTWQAHQGDVNYRYSYTGLGGELQYRKYITPMQNFTSRRNRIFAQGIYWTGFAQGAGFTEASKFQNTHYDPNTGIRTVLGINEYRKHITNGALGFGIGIQRTLWKVIFVDVYVGGGVQVAATTFSKQTHDLPDYVGFPGDAEYDGIIPKMGIQLALAL